MLHILNGDSISKSFAETGIEGEVLVWREALIMGPCPANLSDEEWIQIRAKHLSETYANDITECIESQQKLNLQLSQTDAHENIVLWFEFDLFCQTNMVYVLNRLAQLKSGKTKIFLICIDAFPDMPKFRGLGQLSSTQLASLLPQKQQVSPQMRSLASAIWQAYVNADPTGLESILRQDTSALPNCKEAFSAHLERFPSVKNGLGRIENLSLDLISGGIDEFEPLFYTLCELEPKYGFGDAQIWKQIEFMSKAVNPLLTIYNAPTDGLATDYSKAYFKLTTIGKAILVGNSDMMNVNNVDYWLGGVHVVNDTEWRWDDAAEKITRV